MNKLARGFGRWTLWLSVGLFGCSGANSFRLDEVASMYNDDLRWGRMPAAEMAVTNALRPRFTREHASWGHAVQIVDIEQDSIRASGMVGVARTRFIWTRSNEVDTRETVVETRWHARLDGGWVCEDERVVSGDPSLLASR